MLSHFKALGVQVTAEDASASGRLDMAVRIAGHVYLFEFKIAGKRGTAEGESEGRTEGKAKAESAALVQLRERGYADKYRDLGVPIHLLGIEFDPDRRELVTFETVTE